MSARANRITRRRLMQQGSLLVGAQLLPRALAQSMAMPMPQHRSAKTLDALKLPSFVDPLPLPQVLRPEGRRSAPEHDAADAPYYRIRIREIAAKLHHDLPAARVFSYADTAAPPLMEARTGEGILIEWVNDLPARHLFPLDGSMPGMPALAGLPETRTVAHVHGARVPSVSDGYPEDWFAPGHSKLCFYPNQQDSAALWFHDHAMGSNRLNIFAGLMGLYILRDNREAALNLPSGPYELPLLIYDRSLTPTGQLYYPNPPDEGTWTDEFLGDAMIVNGKLRPFHNVEPRRYRLRIANTANARFFSLAISNNQPFHIIGSDQGLLSAPVEAHRILLAPAERTDLIVDFSHARGQNITLTSGGDDLLQFRVSKSLVRDTSTVPATLRTISRIPEANADRTRLLTLNQFDAGNGSPMVMLLNRKHWHEPVTEIVKLDSTEIWSLINLTDDTHPIHLHMVRFQVLDRRNFSVFDYLDTETLAYTATATAPPKHELGWKDVVQCPPGMVTRIIINFSGYPGRYLWHCHILEHEANDMMRPYLVEA